MINTNTKSQTPFVLALALLDQARELLVAASMPSARPSAPAPPATSPPVAAILRALHVTVEDFGTSRNSASPRGARAVAARRAIVGLLAAEGLGVAQIARETGLAESTVREYLPR